MPAYRGSTGLKKKGPNRRLQRRRAKVAATNGALTVDPLARSAVAGHMGVLLTIRELAEQVARANEVDVRAVEIMPAWSHEDDDRSRISMNILIEARPEQRFIYWEALSDKVEL